MEILSGIIERPYLGGFRFDKLPGPIDPSEATQWEDRRMVSGLMIRRAAVPYTGAPTSPGKLMWKLTWDTPGAADLERLLRLKARAAFISMDWCLWVPDCESFWIATGETAAGTLPRREAMTVIDSLYWPANAATRFAVKSYENESAGNIALGAASSVTYRQAWTGGTANALNEIIYVPCYRVWGDFQRTFQTAQKDIWTVTLREV